MMYKHYESVKTQKEILICYYSFITTGYSPCKYIMCVMYNILCEYKDTEGNYSIVILYKTQHCTWSISAPMDVNQCQSHRSIMNMLPSP